MVVTGTMGMSIQIKQGCLEQIPGRYERAGEGKRRAAKKKGKPGPKKIYEGEKLLGPLKTIWLLADQPSQPAQVNLLSLQPITRFVTNSRLIPIG
jgi:hypothetical protein